MGHLGDRPAFTLGLSAFAINHAGARALYTEKPITYPARGPAPTVLGRIGGLDEAHAWIERRIPARGDGTEALVLFAGSQWRPSDTRFSPENLLEQPDGTLWGAGELGYGDEAPQAEFYAWSSTGAVVKPHLPGGDMQHALRMPSGELVAGERGKTGLVVLRRWSPTAKVSDLVAKESTKSEAPIDTRVGTTHAVMATKVAGKPGFTWYDGNALTTSKLDTADATDSWSFGTDDTLYVTTKTGELLVEHADGHVEKEKLPQPGTLSSTTRTTWLLAKSGALYIRFANGWLETPLRDGPWSAADHGPRRVEWVRDAGTETLVGTVQTEAQGFGRRRPGEVRTVYSTSNQPAKRCGAPFEANTMATLPPAAHATCTSPLVLVARDGKTLPNGYPKIAAALKGNAVGPSLDVVSFGAQLVGIRVPSLETGKVVVESLRKAQYSPELLCGAEPAARTLHLDVQTGAFSN